MSLWTRFNGPGGPPGAPGPRGAAGLDGGPFDFLHYHFTFADFNAAWDSTPGDPVVLPVASFSVPTGYLLWGAGVALLTSFNDSFVPSVGWSTATPGHWISKQTCSDPVHSIGNEGTLLSAASGDNVIGTWTRINEPLRAASGPVGIHAAMDGWNGDASQGEVVLWALVSTTSLI